MSTEGFRIIQKDKLREWFSAIIDKYVQEMGWDLSKPEDLAALNEVLNEFSREMFYR